MAADTILPENTRITIEELSLEQAEQIEPLWQQLNTLHHRHSIHFKDHFASFSFSDRLQQLTTKDSTVIFLALVGAQKVGYCLCSSHDDIGEIDSIFLDESQRSSGLGKLLVEKALQWFNEKGLSQLTVSIAHGNEEVIPFYEQFGFKPRLVVMTTNLAE